MQNIHRIRLRGPWQYELLTADATTAQTGQIRLPASWQELFPDYAGTIRFRRRFHKPTNLEPQEQVFIVLAGYLGTVDVSLNEKPVGTGIGTESDPTDAWEVTSLLQSANELVIEMQFDQAEIESEGGLYAPVVLEIRNPGLQSSDKK